MGDIVQQHIQQFLKERVLGRKDSIDMTICLGGTADAYKILKEEERHEDMIEFHALICAYLIAEEPRTKEHNAEVLYKRFRDLLTRAVTPTCSECQ